MPRTPTVEPSTEFAIWLDAALQSKGWERKTLFAKAGVGQSSISQIMAGIRKPSRDMVERLARALSPDDADEYTARALLNSGLSAAGFRAEDDELAPDIQMIVEAYSGGTDTGRRAIKSAAELALELAREGAIGGKRAE